MTDQRARDEAIRAVAAYLTGRLAPTLDPAHVAAGVLDVLHDLGWRFVPRPQPIAPTGPRDPEAYERGAALARTLLDRRGDRDA